MGWLEKGGRVVGGGGGDAQRWEESFLNIADHSTVAFVLDIRINMSFWVEIFWKLHV